MLYLSLKVSFNAIINVLYILYNLLSMYAAVTFFF